MSSPWFVSDKPSKDNNINSNNNDFSNAKPNSPEPLIQSNIGLDNASAEGGAEIFDFKQDYNRTSLHTDRVHDSFNDSRDVLNQSAINEKNKEIG